MARFDIVIVDYGMANLRSVQKAFEQVGFPAHITSDPQEIRDARKIVLPGVGAFQDAIAKLRDTQLADVLVEHIHGGRPFLGICLGLQMLFTQSHEDGLHTGLNMTPGDVVRFPKTVGLKVPHMGWNSIRLTQPNCPLFRGLPTEPYFYFVHGYYAEPTNKAIITAETDYPTSFCSVIWQDNLYATQFHPEKSQGVGLQMLKNFAQL